MAFGNVGNAGLFFSTSSGTTVGGAFVATIEAGNVALVIVAMDNIGTADGDNSEVSSVVDTQGNVYTKLKEFTNANGAGAAGATVSIWASVLTTQVTITTDSLTVNLASSRVAKAAIVHEFTCSAGAVLTVAGSGTLANDAADPGNITVGSLASREYLFVRGIASESSSTTLITVTAGYGSLGRVVADTGVSSGSMGARGEYRILTATTSSSDPTLFSADHASAMVAIQEDVPAAGHPAMRRLGRQPFRPVEIGRKSPGGVWAVQYGVARLPGVLVAA